MRGKWRLLLLSLLALFLYTPIVVVMASSLNATRQMAFPPRELSARWYLAFFEDASWYGALNTSVAIAAGAAVLATALALICNFLLWSSNSKIATRLQQLMALPFLLPGIVFAVALSLLMTSIGLLGTYTAVVLGHTAAIVAIPLITIRMGFDDIDPANVEAARLMGVTQSQMLPELLVPALRPYLLTGGLFAFILSMNEYVIAMLLSSFAFETLPMRVLNSQRYGFTPSLSVGTVLYILFSLTCLGYLAARGRLLSLMGLGNSTRAGR